MQFNSYNRGDTMKKEMEMVCVSDIEGFDRELYEKTSEKLAEHLGKFGWTMEDCVFEEDGKVWCCKPAAIWFLTPAANPDDWD